ncbi:MAG: hemerythrin domain-containing protein [Caenispirillum sp.]|nr:hemerythrin domain-containing protein [Caenispirillum sp.]
MTDIFKALTEDHREVLDILRTITAESDPQRRRVLFDEVKGALRTHSEFERKAFYPEAERQSDRIDRAEIASDLEEHDEAEAILKAMETEDPSSEAWMQHCRRLYNAVEEHAGHEEHVLFPLAEAALPADRARALGEEYQRQWKG